MFLDVQRTSVRTITMTKPAATKWPKSVQEHNKDSSRRSWMKQKKERPARHDQTVRKRLSSTRKGFGWMFSWASAQHEFCIWTVIQTNQQVHLKMYETKINCFEFELVWARVLLGNWRIFLKKNSCSNMTVSLKLSETEWSHCTTQFLGLSNSTLY